MGMPRYEALWRQAARIKAGIALVHFIAAAGDRHHPCRKDRATLPII